MWPDWEEKGDNNQYGEIYVFLSESGSTKKC